MVMLLKRRTYIWLVWLRVDVRTPERHDVFNRDWDTCSNFVNHSRINSQHNWGGLPTVYDHSMSSRIFTLMISKMHMSSRNYDLELAIISHQWRVSHRRRTGSRGKGFHLRHAYFTDDPIWESISMKSTWTKYPSPCFQEFLTLNPKPEAKNLEWWDHWNSHLQQNTRAKFVLSPDSTSTEANFWIRENHNQEHNRRCTTRYTTHIPYWDIGSFYSKNLFKDYLPLHSKGTSRILTWYTTQTPYWWDFLFLLTNLFEGRHH